MDRREGPTADVAAQAMARDMTGDQGQAGAAAEAQSANVIWLASYPKTGSTWVREILRAALCPESPEARKEAIPAFAKTYPYDAPVFELLGQKTHVVKTHQHPKSRRMAQCRARTVGLIGMRRHPLDIMLSAMNYAKLKAPPEFFLKGQPKPVEEIVADGEFLYYIDRFRDEDGFPWFAGPCAEFSLYRKRWRKHTQGLPRHEICYEKLFADPSTEIARLMRFLGLPDDAKTVKGLYAAADLRTAQDGGFFWKRRAYNFQEILPEELVAAFHERCAVQIAAFAYPATP